MNNRGFTLMELVVTVTLLAILMAIALPASSVWRQNAQHKETAREVLSVLRRARSTAVQRNQSTTVTFDLTSRTYSLGGVEDNLAKNVKVEARESEDDSWEQSGTATITFRPQGTADDTIFVRINGDDNLQVRVDSIATGLAHM
jgi:prepilin-type N-terminal cleavage/methylation domain-containing protein